MKKMSVRSSTFGALRGQRNSRRPGKTRSQTVEMVMPVGAMATAIRSPLSNRMTAEEPGLCRTSLFTQYEVGRREPEVQRRKEADNGRASTRLSVSAVLVSLVALMALMSGCTAENTGLSIEEARACAMERFRGHPGMFEITENTISYAYESRNGQAKVIVTFDKGRPTSTFFESTPYGSHEELMDAAKAIKNCVAYGPKAKPAVAGG